MGHGHAVPLGREQIALEEGRAFQPLGLGQGRVDRETAVLSSQEFEQSLSPAACECQQVPTQARPQQPEMVGEQLGLRGNSALLHVGQEVARVLRTEMG